MTSPSPKYVVFYDLPVTLDMSMISQSVPVPRLLRKPAQIVMNSLIGKVKIPGPIAAKASQYSGKSPSIPYSWNPKYPARIGVMPREGDDASRHAPCAGSRSTRATSSIRSTGTPKCATVRRSS